MASANARVNCRCRRDRTMHGKTKGLTTSHRVSGRGRGGWRVLSSYHPSVIRLLSFWTVNSSISPSSVTPHESAARAAAGAIGVRGPTVGAGPVSTAWRVCVCTRAGEPDTNRAKTEAAENTPGSPVCLGRRRWVRTRALLSCEPRPAAEAPRTRWARPSSDGQR